MRYVLNSPLTLSLLPSQGKVPVTAADWVRVKTWGCVKVVGGVGGAKSPSRKHPLFHQRNSVRGRYEIILRIQSFPGEIVEVCWGNKVLTPLHEPERLEENSGYMLMQTALLRYAKNANEGDTVNANE